MGLGASQLRILQSLIGRLPSVGMVHLTPEGVILDASDGYCQLLGRDSAEVIGHSPLEFTHADDLTASEASFATLSTQPSEKSRMIKRYVRPDGEMVWVRVSWMYRSSSHDLISFVEKVDDIFAIGERRRVAMVENAADAVMLIGRDGRVKDFNPTAKRLFAGEEGKLVADCIRDRIHSDDVQAAAEAITAVIAKPAPGFNDSLVVRAHSDEDDELYFRVILSNHLDDPAVQGIIINAHDITAERMRISELRKHEQALSEVLVRAVEFRDPYTAGHQAGVADLSGRIAKKLGFSEAAVEPIQLGARVHDVGKISIPSEILSRPGRLNKIETEMVRAHSQIGFSIVETSGLPSEATDIVLHHHERMDGSGYPHGLRDEEIAIETRIVAVADVVDAIMNHRPYRAALGPDAAQAEIQRGAGTLYDRQVVEAALSVLGDRTLRA